MNLGDEIPVDTPLAVVQALGVEMFGPFLVLAVEDDIEGLQDLLDASARDDLANALGALLIFLVTAPGETASSILAARVARAEVAP